MHTLAQKPKATQQTMPVKSPKSSRSFVGQNRDAQSVLHLQQTIGNQAVLRLLQTATENLDSSTDSPTVRPRAQQSAAELRLTERVADQVVAMPIPIPPHSNPQDRTLPSSRITVERAPSFMNRHSRGYWAQMEEPYVRTIDRTQRIPTTLKDGIAALRSGGQRQQNVISLSWDDPNGPERTRFRALERSLREHGFDFVEEGEYFRVSVPPNLLPALGIHDLIPPPQRPFHRLEILSAMRNWLPLAIRQEQRSGLAGAVQGPNIVDILNAAFAFRWQLTTPPALWVMSDDDTYTRRVRLWGPVTHQLRVVKQHLEQNCEEWMSEHRTNTNWMPSTTPPPGNAPPNAWDAQENPEGGSWAMNPPGTSAQVCQSLYMRYRNTMRVPDQLWTSAIGSFGLYVTVDSISCRNGSAVLNVWMYNNMDQNSFGDPESWFSAAELAMLWSGGVDPQYMWWHWTEPHHWAPRAPE